MSMFMARLAATENYTRESSPCAKPRVEKLLESARVWPGKDSYLKESIEVTLRGSLSVGISFRECLSCCIFRDATVSSASVVSPSEGKQETPMLILMSVLRPVLT